ncbi:MAG: hypothetical protein HFJ46_04735 [Clostridia bacterium]|nr:hypothetical protein [Clostridia bacterium]
MEQNSDNKSLNNGITRNDLGKKSKDIAKNLTSQELDSVKGLLKAYREFEKTGELPKTNEQDLSK